MGTLAETLIFQCDWMKHEFGPGEFQTTLKVEKSGSAKL